MFLSISTTSIQIHPIQKHAAERQKSVTRRQKRQVNQHSFIHHTLPTGNSLRITHHTRRKHSLILCSYTKKRAPICLKNFLVKLKLLSYSITRDKNGELTCFVSFTISVRFLGALLRPLSAQGELFTITSRHIVHASCP